MEFCRIRLNFDRLLIRRDGFIGAPRQRIEARQLLVHLDIVGFEFDRSIEARLGAFKIAVDEFHHSFELNEVTIVRQGCRRIEDSLTCICVVLGVAVYAEQRAQDFFVVRRFFEHFQQIAAGRIRISEACIQAAKCEQDTDVLLVERHFV